ncbi:hypothetical protein [Chryseobacterium gregarium]|uniref:hypothetical protein n=1 Tax=Chryseobacterium gregarium TaxID=456299 RepID=UPI0004219C55|nr:hypothetical protein [Chryseobacterium gregarium]
MNEISGLNNLSKVKNILITGNPGFKHYLLSLTAAFAEMKSKHENFEVIFAGQAEANAGLRQMTSASAIRKDLEKHLKSYFSLLTAMKEVDRWQLLYSDTNELVKAAKNSAQQKDGRETETGSSGNA